MNRNYKILTAGIAAGAAAAVLTSCGGGGSKLSQSSSSSNSYLGTQAPGDVWNWDLTSSTFTATNTTKNTTYSGSASLLQSGFYKLTVANSTDPNVSAGSAAYAFQVPGVAMICQPAGSDTNPIVAAGVGGANPTGTLNTNFIAIPSAEWTPNDESYGTATIVMGSNNQGTVTITQNQLNGTVIGTHSQTLSFNDGEFTTGSDTGIITQAGVILVDDGPGQGGIVGVAAGTTNVDLSDLANQQYRGILFKGGSSSGAGSQLIEASPAGGNSLTAEGYSDVDTNQLDTTHPVTVAFTGQPNPGLIDGTLTLSSSTENFIISASKVDGKYMIFGFGFDSADNAVDNFLLIQQ